MVSLTPWKRRNVPVRLDEGSPLALLRREFDDLWNRFMDEWERPMGMLESFGFGRKIDLRDEENEYVLCAEMPGFEPDEIDLRVSGNVLTISAEHKEEQKEENGRSHYRYGRFQESFTLPSGVLADKIDARYHSGVLEVHLPKSEEGRPKRIAVKSA